MMASGLTTFGCFSNKPSVQSTTLIDVLQPGPVEEKYYLSPKAAKGILRRAARRGRKLPEVLEDALKKVSDARKRQRTRRTPSTRGGGDAPGVRCPGG